MTDEEKQVVTENATIEPKYCDRNLCLQNEYNNIGCENCIVNKGE